MTIEELSKKYGYSEVTIKNAFPQVQRYILKKFGVMIEKEGRGKNANYIEKEKPEELQMKELKEFLDKNPAVKEYFEGIEG